ncbi:MAG: M23 family metallopeptidase [candidate division WOR-3 bacterium]
MGRIHFIILVFAIFFNVFFVYSTDIIFPTENNIITGGFGEFRWNHFHAGLDISTDGIEGKKVYSPSNCYVSYIKRDFYGYGNTLFLEDENYIYVFAHLKNFVTKIDTLLSKNKYRQTIYPEKGNITFSKGEVIAYTGSSGGVLPHLHFEIRKKNNSCINPLFLYNIYDTINPSIEGILFEPADDTTLINGVYDNYYVVTKKNGITLNQIDINISGKFFLSGKFFDRINSISSKIFVYKINIKSDDKIVSSIVFDSLSFNYNKFSPLHFRTDLKVSNSNYLIKFYDFFKAPFVICAKETLYSNIDTNITVEVYDHYGNVSNLKINVKNVKLNIKSIENELKIKKINKKLVLITKGIYSNYTLNEPYINYFSAFQPSTNYKYYILSKECNIKSKNIIDGILIDKNIVLIKSANIFNLTDSISISSFFDLYFLYNTKEFHHREFQSASQLFDFSLTDDISKEEIKIYLKGYNGYSFYNVSGENISFVKKLAFLDSLIVNKLSDFVIGKDTIKPKVYLNKKYESSGNITYIFKIIDQGSGVDWFFISDSNYLYVEPLPGESKVKLRINKNEKKFFVVKDKEGNRDTIFLY